MLRAATLRPRLAAARGLVSRRFSRSVGGTDSQVCAILGGQWGDEGKGKLADVLAQYYDVVARFNGGNNAGHTVVAGGRKFAFHLLPCGLIYPHTTNILGNGTVINLPALFEELAPLDDAGIEWRGRLLLSDRAHLLFDHHKAVDGALEARRGSGEIGTTKKGIGPAYASKMSRTNPRVGLLREWDSFEAVLRSSAAQHEELYGVEVDVEGEVDRCKQLKERVLPMIVDSVQFMNGAHAAGKRIIAEGANAAMLDVDFGTYPYVTSSNTTAGGISTGLGLSPDKVQTVVGVIKAYTTRVGAGPFPTELDGDLGTHLQTAGAEFGVTTGRTRRCGWLDLCVVRYSHMVNNYTSINLTKLDVLSDLDTLRLGVAYEVDGQRLPPGAMPSTLEALGRVEVVYEDLPGWRCDISAARTFSELPENAQRYVKRVEELVGCPVSWIGVGSARDDMIRQF